MNESYQAIFEAIRSRVSYCNIDSAIQSAVRDAFGMAGHYLACVSQEYLHAATEQYRPSVLFRPRVFVEGNQWCALYGENIQDGVAGFGSSPNEAVRDFDKNWRTPLESKP